MLNSKGDPHLQIVESRCLIGDVLRYILPTTACMLDFGLEGIKLTAKLYIFMAKTDCCGSNRGGLTASALLNQCGFSVV